MSGCRCSDGALSQDWHTRQPSRVYCYAWWSQLSVSTIGHSTREPRPSHLSSSLILYSDGMMYRVVSNVVIFVVCHVHIPIFYPHVNMIFYATILWPNYISLQSLSLSHSSTLLCPALPRFIHQLPVPLLPLSFTPDLTTVILSTIYSVNLNYPV